MAFGPLFPAASNFSRVGIDFLQETDYNKSNSTKFSAITPMVDIIDRCTGLISLVVRYAFHFGGLYILQHFNGGWAFRILTPAENVIGI